MAVTRRMAHGAEIGVLLGIGDVLLFRHFMGAGVTDMLNFDLQSTNDNSGERAEREALYTCLAMNLIVSGLLGSLDAFIVSGAFLIGLDFSTKHAIAVNPSNGKVTQGQPVSGDQSISNVMPLPNYAEGGAAYGYGG
jgi:hypothetical protein